MKASLALLLFTMACGGSSAVAPEAAAVPSGGPSPTCEQVTAHIRELALVASGARTEAQKTEALREIEPALAVIADECEAPETRWSEVFRRCVMAARDRPGVKACDDQNPKPSGEQDAAPP